MNPETKKCIFKIIENGDEFEAIKFLVREIEKDMILTQKKLRSQQGLSTGNQKN